MKSVLKIGISWIAVLSGLVLGVFGLAMFGSVPVLGLWTSSRLLWFASAEFVFGASFFIGSLAATRNPKLAAGVMLPSAILLPVLIRFSDFVGRDDEFLSSAVPCIVCLAYGLFWFLTSRRRWPRFFPQKPLSSFAKAIASSALSLLLISAISIAAIALTLRVPDIGDCGEGPPVSKPYPETAVFVARVVHFDSFLGAVAVVQERFWGLPNYSKIVFLKASLKAGDIWFVDGRLSSGLLTRRVLPVIVVHCSRSAPIEYAKVDLRVLRSGRPQSGVRIVGRVEKRRNWRQTVPDAKLLVIGPQGTTTTTTDEEGIYDVSGLPPGQYEVRVKTDKGERSNTPSCGNTMNLTSGDVGGCTLRID